MGSAIIQLNKVVFYAAHARINAAAGNLLLESPIKAETSTSIAPMDQYAEALVQAKEVLGRFQGMLQTDVAALKGAGDALIETDHAIAAGL